MRLETTAIIILAALGAWGCKTPDSRVTSDPVDDRVAEGPTTPEAPVDPDETSAKAPDEGRVAGDESAEDDAGEEDGSKPTTFMPEPKLPKKLGLQEMALVRTAEQKLEARPNSPIVFYPVIAAGENQCGESTRVTAGLDHESGESYSLDECDRTIDALHAETYTRHVTKFGATDISFVAVRHNGIDLWSAANACEEMLGEDHCSSDFVEGEATVLSLVGPIVTINLTWSEAREGEPPQHGEDRFTFDTRTGKLAPLDALITEDSLLNALKRDTDLRTAVNPTALDAAQSPDDVWDLWRTQDFDHFGSYHFHAWDAENERVALRIGFREDPTGLSQNEMKELRIWVKPKKQFLPAFEAAARGEGGFYASD